MFESNLIFSEPKKQVGGAEVGADQEQVDGSIMGEWDKHLQKPGTFRRANIRRRRTRSVRDIEYEFF
jgi:hypothetical protein